MEIKKGAVTLPEWWLGDTPSDSVIAITDGNPTCCCEATESLYLTVIDKKSHDCIYEGYFHTKELTQDESVDYRGLSFLQGEEADIAFDLYEGYCGIKAVFNLLMTYKPDEPELFTEYPGGDEDSIHVIDGHIIGVNSRLHTISLTQVVKN